jgi:beta-galactosidase
MKKYLLWVVVIIISSCANLQEKNEKSLDFVRKLSINSNWKFHLGDIPLAEDTNFNDSDWRTIDIPHDWAIEGPFSSENASATGYLPGGIGWYRKVLEIPDFNTDRKYTLMFDGAYQNAEVWFNGHYLGKRPYGYSSFYYNITEFIIPGKEKNLIAVKLDHSQVADSRWYTGNGIYRNVWLETTNKIYVKTWGTFISTPKVSEDSATVAVQVEIRNDLSETKEVEVVSTLFNNENKEYSKKSLKVKLASAKDSTLNFDQIILNPGLWSPESPQMYISEITIHTLNGNILDSYKTPFGIRTIKFDPDKGLSCNGKSYKLKGVCMHQDYGALGSARTPEVIYPVLKKLKAAGCNAIRTSHNPEDPEYLNMVDTMGFFVMEEAFDEFKRGKKKWIKGRNVGQNLGIKAYPKYYDRHGYSDFYEEWAKRDIQNMVKRDKNHPSIIMWSIGNETDYPNDPYQDPNIKSTFDPTLPSPTEIAELDANLVAWVKEVDKTRPVTQALANTPVTNAVGVPEILDVVGYNYQESYYEQDHKKYPKRIIFGSENSHNAAAWKAVRDNEYIAGQFLWTGMDYHGEAGIFPNHSFSGTLIDYCGFENPIYYFQKSLWTSAPMAKLVVQKTDSYETKMHWNWQKGNKMNVVCYTNLEEAELFLNGKSCGRKKVDKDKLTMAWHIDYAEGTLSVKCFENGQEKATDILQTAGKPENIILKPTVVKSNKFNTNLIQVEVDMVDEKGIIVPSENSLIEFELTGDAKILGVCNSDYSSIESYISKSRLLYEGRCQVIIKSQNSGKGFDLKVKSEQLNKTVSWHL